MYATVSLPAWARHLVTIENGLFRAVPTEQRLLHYYANAIVRPVSF